jgi:hypothetical protein
MKIYCVCDCGEHSNEDASIEINFRDNSIYFVCTKFKKENKIEFKSKPYPFPKTRRM